MGEEGGVAPRALAEQLGVDPAEAEAVLRRLLARGWLEAGDDLLDGRVTPAAPRRRPSFGSFAGDGHWSEDRWGHRIFHPRCPRPEGADPGRDDADEPGHDGPDEDEGSR